MKSNVCEAINEAKKEMRKHRKRELMNTIRNYVEPEELEEAIKIATRGRGGEIIVNTDGKYMTIK